jgi:hypothetical protein
MEKLDGRSQADLDPMPSGSLGFHFLAATESAIAKLLRQAYGVSARFMRGRRSVNRDNCVRTAGNVNPVSDVFLLPEPAQLGQAQNAAIPIQRGHTPEIESKEAQNFSLVGVRHHVQ